MFFLFSIFTVFVNWIRFKFTEHTFMKNQKGKLCLIMNGSVYYKTTNWKNSTFWMCADYFKSNRCKVSCTMRGSKIIRKSGIAHNHKPHDERIKKLAYFNQNELPLN